MLKLTKKYIGPKASKYPNIWAPKSCCFNMNKYGSELFFGNSEDTKYCYGSQIL